MDQKSRVGNILKNLEGVDAAERLRGAQREIARELREGRRRAEVDGPLRTTDIMQISVMTFENKDGTWRAETTGDVFPGQDGIISATDQTERLALAEFRWRLAEEMLRCRFCRAEDAKTLASKANVQVHGRVPYIRITTTVA